jgi:hypothetical protein
MSQTSQLSDAANQKQQLNTRNLIILALVVFVIAFTLGVIVSRGVAAVLSDIGNGLQNAAHWLDSTLDNPAAYHSGAALESYESGDDPDLYSPSEKSRLKERGG